MNTRRRKIWWCVLGLGLQACGVWAQGFLNLDFEAANVVPIPSGNTNPPSTALFGDAFPGWRGYYGTTALLPTTIVNYNSGNAGTPALGFLTGSRGISNNTAQLQGGVAGNDLDYSLAQTALVPAGTLSLRFQAYRVFENRTFDIRLGGQLLTPVVLQEIGFTRIYGANIPSLAGQVAELRFTQGHGQANANDLFLDNISFSPQGVPEPGTWALLTLGGALLWCATRRRLRT